MKSLGSKVKQVGAMADTRDLTPTQNDIVKNVVAISNNGQDTTRLSSKQVQVIEDLYQRHFGDDD